MATRENLLTDVVGLRVGHAEDPVLASGVTAILVDRPNVAAVVTRGGAPGQRDTGLLEPEMTVEGVDGVVLSGGSAFGLDAAGGVMAALRARGQGLSVGSATVPIIVQAIVFDLLNGGQKDWGQEPIYWRLGLAAAEFGEPLCASARDCRRRLWCYHRGPQGRARLGECHDRVRVHSGGDRRRQCRRIGDRRGWAAFLGRALRAAVRAWWPRPATAPDAG